MCLYAPHLIIVVYVLITGSSQWKTYTMDEHLYNVRAFARYMANDEVVIWASPLFHDLPADSGRETRSRKPKTTFSTTSDDNPPKKSRFDFAIKSESDTDGEREDEVAGDASGEDDSGGGDDKE